MKYGLTLIMMTIATTCHAATLATTSGPDLTWTGAGAPTTGPFAYQLDVTFSPDFGAATATYSAPESGYPDQSWPLTWAGMDEATRRFYSSADARAAITLNGSNWDQLADDTFGQLVQTIGVEWWPADLNPDNLVVSLTAEATPVVSVVPEPSAIVLALLGIGLTWRRRRA